MLLQPCQHRVLMQPRLVHPSDHKTVCSAIESHCKCNCVCRYVSSEVYASLSLSLNEHKIDRCNRQVMLGGTLGAGAHRAASSSSAQTLAATQTATLGRGTSPTRRPMTDAAPGIWKANSRVRKANEAHAVRCKGKFKADEMQHHCTHCLANCLACSPRDVPLNYSQNSACSHWSFLPHFSCSRSLR